MASNVGAGDSAPDTRHTADDSASMVEEARGRLLCFDHFRYAT